MRFLLLFLFLFAIQIVSGQNEQKVIVKSGITKSREKSFYFENDKNGNTIFSKNIGMNGPITMIFASEYDSLKRETRSLWVHSNFGYFLSEKVYEKGCVKSYNYRLKTVPSFPYDRETLNKVKSRGDFTQLKIFQELQNGDRILNSINFIDSANNLIKEIYFSESGDTTSIFYYKYNSKNQQVFFHYGTMGSGLGTWDIYYLYDTHDNKIKSFRIASSNGIQDTTEVYNYFYNGEDLLIYENYYNKNKFVNKTEYFYNSKQVVKELFYERDESTPDVMTIFKYDKKGNIDTKTQYDYRNSKKDQKKVFKTKFEYW